MGKSPEESVEFRIGAEGYVSIDPIPLTARDKEAVIVLKPAVDVRLRVVDAETGKPIPRFGIQTGRADKGSQDFRWGGAIGSWKVITIPRLKPRVAAIKSRSSPTAMRKRGHAPSAARRRPFAQ